MHPPGCTPSPHEHPYSPLHPYLSTELFLLLPLSVLMPDSEESMLIWGFAKGLGKTAALPPPSPCLGMGVRMGCGRRRVGWVLSAIYLFFPLQAPVTGLAHCLPFLATLTV